MFELRAEESDVEGMLGRMDNTDMMDTNLIQSSNE
jgi:hypothetical protein